MCVHVLTCIHMHMRVSQTCLPYLNLLVSPGNPLVPPGFLSIPPLRKAETIPLYPLLPLDTMSHSEVKHK